MIAKQPNELLLGIPEIDQQHQHLMGLVEQLRSALGQGLPQPVVSGLLEHLVCSTQTHFKAEEALMLSIRFHGGKVHCLEHMDLLQRVHAFKDKFDSGDSALTPSVINFLKRWLVDHIRGADAQFARAFHAAAGTAAGVARLGQGL